MDSQDTQQRDAVYEEEKDMSPELDAARERLARDVRTAIEIDGRSLGVFNDIRLVLDALGAADKAPACTKCGGVNIAVTYHNTYYGRNGCGLNTQRWRSDEHLHRTCQTCSWDWTEDCVGTEG